MTFLLRKIFRFMFTLFGISLLAFTFTELAKTSPTAAEQVSYLSNLQDFYVNMFQGDFGLIQHSHESVKDIFFTKLSASAELLLPAIFFAWLFGAPVAIWAVQKPQSVGDKIIQILGVSTYSLPVFWLGMILILLFATGLEWLPVGGRLDYIYVVEPVTGFMLIDTLLSTSEYAYEAFFDALRHLMLPLTTLTFVPLGYVALQLRAGMEDVHNEEFIMAARSRGLSNRRILWMHSLPNAIQPVIAAMSLQFSMLVTSLIIVESLYSWPGVGHWFLLLIKQQDFIALRGALILIATFILLLNVTTEIMRYLASPKLRRE